MTGWSEIVAGFGAFRTRFVGSDVAKGATFTLSIRVFGAALAFATQLFLARTMGAEQLGIFVFAWTWLSAAAFLTPLGFDTALVRFVASFAGTQQWGHVRGVLRLGFQSTLAASVALMLVGLAIIVVAGDRTAPYTQALLIALPAIPVLALVNLHEGIARGFRWIYQVSMPTFGLRPSVFLLLVLGFALTGQPLASSGAMAAMACACLLTWLFQFWRYRRSLPPQVHRAVAHVNTAAWLPVALPMVLVVSFEQLLANTDIVMLGVLEDARATGVYNIGVRIVGIALFVFFAVSAFAAPRIAELFSQNKTVELVRFASKVRLAIALPTLLGLVLLGAIGMPLLRVFGAEFTEAYLPMMILSLAVAARALAGPVDNLLTMTGRQNTLAKVLGAVALLNVAANTVLIPRYGTLGAASATSASIVIELIWVSILAGRHIGFQAWTYLPKEQHQHDIK